MPWLGNWIRVSHKATVKGCSHLKAQVGQDPLPSSLMWLLAGLRSSLAGGGDINSLPPIGQVSVGLFETWQLIVLRGTGQGEGQRDREEEEKEEERGGKRKYLR